MSRVSRYESNKENVSTDKMWKAGLYIRLSKEDEFKKDESVSIESQRIALKQFVTRNNDISIKNYYVDEDYSGGDFNRPDFIRMKRDIENGLINCVIVKDLSRFGRDVVYVSKFIQQDYVEKQIRLIVVDEAVDSYLKPESVDSVGTNLKILMNNNYLLDNSAKVKFVLNMKKENGEFVGAFPPYGYIRDSENKNKLLIDDEVVSNIEFIFKSYVNGMSQADIARELNKRGELSPAKYLISKYKNIHINGCKGVENLIWTPSSIKNILTKEVYSGDMVQSKRKSINPKSKKIVGNDKDKWIIVQNTHEAIIPRNVFDLVQRFIKDRRIDSFKHDGKPHSLFSGFVKCGDCGYSMTRKQISKKNNKYSWQCSRFLKYRICSKHFFREDDMYNSVFKAIKNMINLAVDFNNIRQKQKQEKKQILKKIDYDMQIEKCIYKSMSIYEKYQDGLIEKEDYLKQKENLDYMIQGYKNLKQIDEVNEQEKLIVEKNILPDILKYKNLKKLTRDVIEEFIDEIIVYDKNEIEIKFKFKDIFNNLKAV